MFQTKEYIEKRHGKTGTDRAFYLNQLTKEYKTTTSEGKRRTISFVMLQEYLSFIND